jgi:hypothetical protein
MAHTIIDNFLNDKDFASIQDALMNEDFPWFFNKSVAYSSNKIANDSLNNWQFTHTFYNNFFPCSDAIYSLKPLIDMIDPAAIIRIKANLTPHSEKHIIYDFHVDTEEVNCKTCVFYINTNDGFTLLEDGSKINSIANRFVSFNSTTLHTGTSCTDQKYRCLININYIEKRKR